MMFSPQPKFVRPACNHIPGTPGQSHHHWRRKIIRSTVNTNLGDGRK
jgi:hypothetical protein